MVARLTPSCESNPRAEVRQGWKGLTERVLEPPLVPLGQPASVTLIDHRRPCAASGPNRSGRAIATPCHLGTFAGPAAQDEVTVAFHNWRRDHGIYHGR